MLYTANYNSPVGNLLLAEKNGALAGIWIEGQKYHPSTGKGEQEPMAPKENSKVLLQAKDWLDRYFAGEKPDVSGIPLAPAGSAFRQDVWKLLCEVPYGEVTTYGEIAKKMAKRKGIAQMSAQAAGGAVSHNPIAIIIPCHRVVGTNGSLTGYSGGIEKKIWLLSHEGIDINRYFIP